MKITNSGWSIRSYGGPPDERPHQPGDPLAAAVVQARLGMHPMGAVVPPLRRWIWRICSGKVWSATVRADSGRECQA
jgi:hypothetical protein